MTAPERMAYLDAAATTAPRRDVLEAIWPYLTGEFGNPSSTHGPGVTAAAALKQARTVVADWLGGRASEVVFTSGGTEANNLAVKGIALANPRGRHIVTSTIEHESVLAACEYLERLHGFTVTRVGVDREGLVDLDAYAAALRPDTTLVTIMRANNEIGTIQPVPHVARLAREHGIPVHTDAVQAAASLPTDASALGVDALSISGHKLGAPKGVGALWVRRGLRLEPLVHGGGQERGMRSGTENVAFAVGLAAAVSCLAGNDMAALARSRDRFIDEVLEAVPGAFLTGHRTGRLPGHASFCFPQINGESVLLELEERGVIASSGSACAAGRTDASHVLLALGLGEDVARTAVRFTFDELPDETREQAVAALREAVGALHSLA